MRRVVAVPGHVVESVPRSRQCSVEVSGDIEGLHHIVVTQTDDGAPEMVAGRAAIGIDMVLGRASV